MGQRGTSQSTDEYNRFDDRYVASDRNTRRILDSIRSQPLPRENFILMRKPQFALINDPSPELNQIRQKAESILAVFRGQNEDAR